MSARGWLLFAAMSVIWGIPYLLIKISVDEVVGAGARVRSTLSVRPCCCRWHCPGQPARSSAGTGKRLLGFAFFEIIAAWLLLSDAERHLTSSMTGLLIAAAPIIAAVLDRLTGGERLGGCAMPGWPSGWPGSRCWPARADRPVAPGRSSRCCWSRRATRSRR